MIDKGDCRHCKGSGKRKAARQSLAPFSNGFERCTACRGTGRKDWECGMCTNPWCLQCYPDTFYCDGCGSTLPTDHRGGFWGPKLGEASMGDIEENMKTLCEDCDGLARETSCADVMKRARELGV